MTRSFRHNSKARERDNQDRTAAREERNRKSKLCLRESERLERMERVLPKANDEDAAKYD